MNNDRKKTIGNVTLISTNSHSWKSTNSQYVTKRTKNVWLDFIEFICSLRKHKHRKLYNEKVLNRWLKRCCANKQIIQAPLVGLLFHINIASRGFAAAEMQHLHSYRKHGTRNEIAGRTCLLMEAIPKPVIIVNFIGFMQAFREVSLIAGCLLFLPASPFISRLIHHFDITFIDQSWYRARCDD